MKAIVDILLDFFDDLRVLIGDVIQDLSRLG